MPHRTGSGQMMAHPAVPAATMEERDPVIDKATEHQSGIANWPWLKICIYVTVATIASLSIATYVVVTNQNSIHWTSAFMMVIGILSFVLCIVVIWATTTETSRCLKCAYIFSLIVFLCFFTTYIIILVYWLITPKEEGGSGKGVTNGTFAIQTVLLVCFIILPFLIRCLALRVKQDAKIKWPWQYPLYWFGKSQEGPPVSQTPAARM